MTQPPKADALAWALLLTLGALWGAAFMATAIATREIAAFALAAGRLMIGAAAVTLFMRWRGERLPPLADRRFWAFALGSAFLSNALPFVSLSWAQKHVAAGLAGVFMASVPLMVLPLGHFLVAGERLTLRRVAGMAIGFAGVLVLIGGDALAGIGTALGPGGALALLAQLACLAAAFGYASGGIVAKRAPQRGLLPFASASLLLAALMVLPAALLAGPAVTAPPSLGAIAALVYLGLVPTGLAMVLLLVVIDRAGPGFLSIVNYLVPLWAILFGWAFLGETVPLRLWAALALILAGLTLGQNLLGLRRGSHARG